MITLHHLNDSRSQRILWLLEELGAPYEIKRYQRHAETRLAPPELKAVHPLGKSPVITDGETTIAESGAMVDYLIRRYGQRDGKPALMPAAGCRDYETYNEWLHYAEGSAMLPLMLNLYVGRLGEAGAPLHPRIKSELANHLGYIDAALLGREYLVGDASNQNAKLPGYGVVNLRTSYKVTDNIQVYGLVENLFDKHYATFGTFFETDAISFLNVTNPRSLNPASPLAAYGGLKVTF